MGHGAGHGGQGDDDAEHDTASYVEGPGEGWWTDGMPMTAPPVIGQ
jgi:hypothetical protein